MVYNVYILHSNCNPMLSTLNLLFANFQRVTTLLNTLLHNNIYNNYLYHVVLILVMTLHIIKLCNCSPDCMYIIMYF